jgi:hypothetical protein
VAQAPGFKSRLRLGVFETMDNIINTYIVDVELVLINSNKFQIKIKFNLFQINV